MQQFWKRAGRQSKRKSMPFWHCALGAMAVLVLSACGTMPQPRPMPPPVSPVPQDPQPQVPVTPLPEPEPVIIREPRLTPPHLRGEDEELLVRAALLLPFSANSAAVREEAQAMYRAAQLALFSPGAEHIILIPKDTAGDARTAQRAARDALDKGADVIIGPLFGTAVEGVAREARAKGAPVLAFTNDRTKGGGGAYVLGLAPEEEVTRLVTFASQALVQPRTSATTPGAGPKLGLLASYSMYGDRVDGAARRAAALGGAQIIDTARYSASGDTEEIDGPIREFARRQILRRPTSAEQADARQTAAGDEMDAEALRRALEGRYQVDGILIAETGKRLLTVAPLLLYHDIDPRNVQFLAVGAPDSDTIRREPSLNGAWFTGTDPVLTDRFNNQFRELFGAEASPLSPAAFDAVRLVAELTTLRGSLGLVPQLMERPDGFEGVVGAYRLHPDGTSERALAILELRNGRVRVIDEPVSDFGRFGF